MATYMNQAGSGTQLFSINYTTADLTAGAVTETLAPSNLPSKYVIHAVWLEKDQEFDTAGGGNAMAIEVGSVADPDKYLGSTNCGHGDGTGEVTTAPGTFTPQMNTGSLRVKFTGDANVDTYTEGDVWLRLVIEEFESAD